MSNKNILKIAGTFLIIFVILCSVIFFINKHYVSTNDYKYPPRIYYLSYGIGISLILYYLVDRKNILNIKEKLNNNFIIFISRHTMWIYFWHIVYVTYITADKINWALRYILILIMSIVTTYLQSIIIRKINIKNKKIKILLDS